MAAPTLRPTACAICRQTGNVRQLYAANFGAEAFNPEVFSARRRPDRIHYRMVCCAACGLVRSDPTAETGLMEKLYAQSQFNYEAQVEDLRKTYGRYLDYLSRYGGQKGALLEIGCGTGFFLREASARGYAEVRGVEPSADAVEKAGELQPHLVCDIMRPGLFAPSSFDAICLFQVFDHIADPGALLDECHKILKPGGLMLFFQHNVDALSARVLGRLSPIIDIEHTYLYGPATLGRLCRRHRLDPRESGFALNTYALSYLLHLLPLPGIAKNLLLRLAATPLGRLRLRLPLGNMYLVAAKDPTPETA